jgi:cytochrome c oxidase subunit 3
MRDYLCRPVFRDRYSTLNVYQIGIAIGLVSISAFFIALIVAYSLRLSTQADWQRFAAPDLLWLSTVTLALSSWILEAARYALRRALVVTYRGRLAATLAFAFVFLLAQIASAKQLLDQGIGTSGNPHGSVFYVFMTLHGLHLSGGMVWLAVLYGRARRLVHGNENDLRRHRRVAQVAAMYWHFMGGLWIVLFSLLLRWTHG